MHAVPSAPCVGRVQYSLRRRQHQPDCAPSRQVCQPGASQPHTPPWLVHLNKNAALTPRTQYALCRTFTRQRPVATHHSKASIIAVACCGVRPQQPQHKLMTAADGSHQNNNVTDVHSITPLHRHQQAQHSARSPAMPTGGLCSALHLTPWAGPAQPHNTQLLAMWLRCKARHLLQRMGCAPFCGSFFTVHTSLDQTLQDACKPGQKLPPCAALPVAQPRNCQPTCTTCPLLSKQHA